MVTISSRVQNKADKNTTVALSCRFTVNLRRPRRKRGVRAEGSRRGAVRENKTPTNTPPSSPKLHICDRPTSTVFTPRRNRVEFASLRVGGAIIRRRLRGIEARKHNGSGSAMLQPARTERARPTYRVEVQAEKDALKASRGVAKLVRFHPSTRKHRRDGRRVFYPRSAAS